MIRVRQTEIGALRSKDRREEGDEMNAVLERVRHRVTVDEFHKMAEAGIFAHGNKAVRVGEESPGAGTVHGHIRVLGQRAADSDGALRGDNLRLWVAGVVAPLIGARARP